MVIRVSWGHMEPHLGGRGGRRGSAMAPFERAMVVSYRLSIVTVALSVTIRLQFVIECLRRSINRRVGSLWAKISGRSPWSRPLMFESAESEHPRLTNVEIISEEFQSVWSQSTNVTYCDELDWNSSNVTSGFVFCNIFHSSLLIWDCMNIRYLFFWHKSTMLMFCETTFVNPFVTATCQPPILA